MMGVSKKSFRFMRARIVEFGAGFKKNIILIVWDIAGYNPIRAYWCLYYFRIDNWLIFFLFLKAFIFHQNGLPTFKILGQDFLLNLTLICLIYLILLLIQTIFIISKWIINSSLLRSQISYRISSKLFLIRLLLIRVQNKTGVG